MNHLAFEGIVILKHMSLQIRQKTKNKNKKQKFEDKGEKM